MDCGTYRRAVGFPSRSDTLCFGLGEVWRRRHWSLRLRCHVRDTACDLGRRGYGTAPTVAHRTGDLHRDNRQRDERNSDLERPSRHAFRAELLGCRDFLDVGMSLAGSAFAFIVLRKRYIAIPAPD